MLTIRHPDVIIRSSKDNNERIMKMKKIFALALALCMVFALCACGSSSAKSEKLVFGTSADYPPYEFIYVNEQQIWAKNSKS